LNTSIEIKTKQKKPTREIAHDDDEKLKIVELFESKVNENVIVYDKKRREE
jgi:hypothetical protein